MEVNKREPHDEFGNRGIGSTTVEIDFQHTVRRENSSAFSTCRRDYAGVNWLG
jgi:hypothetical protein